MHGLACLCRFVHRRCESCVIGQLAIADGFVDASVVLIHDATSTEVHVTNFRVTHLAIRQTNGFA